MVERLASPAAHELDALTDLWERSVRATHDFLAPEDIPFFRRMVRQEALPAAEIYVIRDSGNGFAAFAGIAKKENPFNGFSLPIIEWPQAI